MGKVRRIDWSPDEFIAGTARVLSWRQMAVYTVVLMLIYSRGGECPNDATFIAGHFRLDEENGESWRGITRSVRYSIDALVKLGKLHVSPDGQWLTNGRADAELNKARERIGGTIKAGIASGKARRQKPPYIPATSRLQAANIKPETSNANGLARTTVRNHQPPKIHESDSDRSTTTDAAREPAPDLGAPARAPDQPEPEAQAARPISAEAQSQRERLAEITAAKRAAFLKGRK